MSNRLFAAVIGLLAVGGIVYAATRAKADETPDDTTPPVRKPPCGNYGDVDGDGYVTENDTTMVAEYANGDIILTDEQLARADVNNDGRVDVMDAMMIGQFAKGIIDTFPVCSMEAIP